MVDAQKPGLVARVRATADRAAEKTRRATEDHASVAAPFRAMEQNRVTAPILNSALYDELSGRLGDGGGKGEPGLSRARLSRMTRRGRSGAG